MGCKKEKKTVAEGGIFVLKLTSFKQDKYF